MEIGEVLLIVFAYGAFEFVNSIFFNGRLMLLSEKKYVVAGLFSAVSTVLLVSSVIVASGVASDGTDATQIIGGIIPVVGVMMGIGNFLAAMLVPVLRRKLEKNRQDKKLVK